MLVYPVREHYNTTQTRKKRKVTTKTTKKADRSSFYKILKNVSCEYDRWVVETQLCKLRDTSETLIGRACAMFQLKYGVCE